MKRLSIKMKIMIWFTAAMIVMVFGTTVVNFSISREVLDQTIQERLINTVAANAQEIEYYNSPKGEKEPTDFFLSYKEGTLEIDDDFLDYNEGIYTALVDSENNLLYGEMPAQLEEDEAFSFTSVGTIKYKGEKFYIYEKQLTGDDLQGLWLRGFVSENETTNVLYKMVRLSLWLIPLIGVLSLLGGFVITRRSFLPIESINSAARQIAESGDLSKRIDIFTDNGGLCGSTKKAKDEIQNLACTFNDMFSKLEDAFNAEKQFTSDASHELRTPLSVIKANCEYALDFASSDEEFKEALEIIHRQSNRAASLLSQLLFFARLDQRKTSIKLEDTDLSLLVQSLCDDRRILLSQRPVLNTDIQPEIHTMADKDLITRLVNNLIDNAVKYIGNGDTIKVSLCQNETSVVLSVSDNGIGISPENIPKIWDRFYMEDQSRSQTSENSFGLGLSMVAEIAHLHGGHMEVESVPGKGSRFTLILSR